MNDAHFRFRGRRHAARGVAYASVLATLALLGGTAVSGTVGEYPPTRKDAVIDDYHGTKVADPYRWLEDLDSAETAAWVAAQNEVTFGYLEQISERKAIQERLTSLWDYEKFSVPREEGGRYFYRRNDGLQNQSVLYTARSLDDSPRVLIDPNRLSADGTVALGATAVSDDGNRMVYGTSAAGSDWVEFRVRDIATGKDLEDHLKWVKFSGAAWDKNGDGFYYSRYDEPKAGSNEYEALNYYQKLCYHKLGTPQSADTIVYQRPDQKEWGFSGSVSDDGQYLIITIWKGTERKNRVYYKSLSAPESAVVPLLDDFDAQYSFIDNDGSTFWFFTDVGAPRGQVIAIDTRQPERSAWKTIIPQVDETLNGVDVIDDKFVCTYLKDAQTVVRIFDLSGKHLRDVDLPGIGAASGFSGDRDDTETFYEFESFTRPPTIYRYDMRTGKSAVFRSAKVDFDPSAYETRQVFYTSKDGTRVPMFITHRKGLTLDGTHPTYLYGYGGFNIPVTPRFSVSNLVWLEMGGVYAVANIRGGGEYGKEWHNSGRLKNKQNVFDDFIAAAEWLIENKYTRSERLAIGGGSNGGLLVGACMTQRPELFGAALPAVGVLDMLRFHKFTIGWAWVSDYGSAENPDDFRVLYAYSPLHNLKEGTRYPSTLITTGDHDDRVVPSHSFKFASALQAAHHGDNPVLIRIETRAGHGAGKPTSKIIEEAADRWAFLVRELRLNGSMSKEETPMSEKTR